ncbi:MAG TPA: hypothetical protein VER03_16880 [Bryobacteraceae bacterium]|nr:hypothetical protein [Bryobacteraceae bacterium]
MSSAAVQPAPVTAPQAALDTRWGKLLIPSLSDLFFVAMIGWLFGVGLGWSGLVLDGDTGWHIRTGEYILQTGTVPHQDIFSWSKAGEPWFAWEWLTDVQYALLHGRWGLGGVAVFSGLLICASAYALLRVLVSTGANAFVAGVLTLLYVGGSSLHHHARPHVWTLLLFAIAVGLLVRDRRRPDKLVWVLVPITCVWTNLHGGFLAGIAMVGLAALGTSIEEPRNWRAYGRYLALASACAAASLVNPYGVQLHIHVAEYLRSDFIRNLVQEFRSPGFRTETERQFEAVLLIGIACAGFSLARRRVVEALWVLYFAHAALTSARHIPLYILAAAPLIASEATRWWDSLCGGRPRNSLPNILDAISKDLTIGLRRTTFWLVAGSIAVVFTTTAKTWPTDFSRTFPREMIAAHRDRLQGARLFTTDQWGDYILYKEWPRQKVFFDGRSDFYGAKMGADYLSLMGADFKWPEVVKRYGFNLMLLPVKWPLASVLKLSPEWRVVADDGTAILFEPKNLHK